MGKSDTALSREIRRRHAEAMESDEPGYLDPATGLFVFTAGHHLKRGTCCGSQCRHCPFGRPDNPQAAG